VLCSSSVRKKSGAYLYGFSPRALPGSADFRESSVPQNLPRSTMTLEQRFERAHQAALARHSFELAILRRNVLGSIGKTTPVSELIRKSSQPPWRRRFVNWQSTRPGNPAVRPAGVAKTGQTEARTSPRTGWNILVANGTKASSSVRSCPGRLPGRHPLIREDLLHAVPFVRSIERSSKPPSKGSRCSSAGWPIRANRMNRARIPSFGRPNYASGRPRDVGSPPAVGEAQELTFFQPHLFQGSLLHWG